MGGASWSENGTIVYAAAGSGQLFRVPASGGIPQLLIEPSKTGDALHWWPQFLPGGKQILFTAVKGRYDEGNSEIKVLSLETGNIRTVFRGTTFARYLPTGHLAFLRAGALYAVRFAGPRQTGGQRHTGPARVRRREHSGGRPGEIRNLE